MRDDVDGFYQYHFNRREGIDKMRFECGKHELDFYKIWNHMKTDFYYRDSPFFLDGTAYMWILLVIYFIMQKTTRK